MRKVLTPGIKDTNEKPPKKFKCTQGCGCIWESNEYTVSMSFGTKIRLDKCPQCKMWGIGVRKRVQING